MLIFLFQDPHTAVYHHTQKRHGYGCETTTTFGAALCYSGRGGITGTGRVFLLYGNSYLNGEGDGVDVLIT